MMGSVPVAAPENDGQISDSGFGRVAALAQAHPLLTVGLIAAATRLFIVAVLSKYFSGTLVLDDTTYHHMAAQMAAGEISSWDDFTYSLYWSTGTFMVPITALYKLFGPNPLVGQLFVGVLGTATSCLVARLAMEFLATKWAIVAGLIVALLPSQAFWSSMLMKDAFVWFVLSGLSLTIAVAGRSSGRRLLLMGVVAALFLVLLSYLRLHTLVVASWAFMVAGFFSWKFLRLQRIAGALVIGGLIPLIFGGIGVAGLGLVTNSGSLEDRRFNNAVGANTSIIDTSQPPSGQTPSLEKDASDAESEARELLAAAEALPATDVEKARELRERAAALSAEAETLRALAAAALAEVDRPTPVGEVPLDPNLVHLPRGLSVMLLEPFPVPFEGSLSLRLARIESLIWYPLLAFALYGLFHSRAYLRGLAFPVIAAAGIIVMYALTEGNVGTAHRHRGEVVWVVALLAALGAKQLWGERGSASPS